MERSKTYWMIDSNGAIWKSYDGGYQTDDMCYEIGNYFTTRDQAEEMARKLKAVLKGAEVIEMPCEKEMREAKPTFPMNYDPWDAENIRKGFEMCYEWLKDKIVK